MARQIHIIPIVFSRSGAPETTLIHSKLSSISRPASQAVLTAVRFNSPFTRLVQLPTALRVWRKHFCLLGRKLYVLRPEGAYTDARVYGHTTTAMRDMITLAPIRLTSHVTHHPR